MESNLPSGPCLTSGQLALILQPTNPAIWFTLISVKKFSLDCINYRYCTVFSIKYAITFYFINIQKEKEKAILCEKPYENLSKNFRILLFLNITFETCIYPSFESTWTSYENIKNITLSTNFPCSICRVILSIWIMCRWVIIAYCMLRTWWEQEKGRKSY